MRTLANRGELGAAEIREELGLRDRTHVREAYVMPALAAGLVEMTLPEKPQSRMQKYRLTALGRAALDAGVGGETDGLHGKAYANAQKRT